MSVAKRTRNFIKPKHKLQNFDQKKKKDYKIKQA